jgi:hypothetical protein
MGRKDWTSDKIFERLLNNKTQSTYWENIRELRRRPNKEVYNRAYKLAKSKVDKEKIIGINILAQLGFDPRFEKEKTLKLYFEILENEKDDEVILSLLHAIGHNNEKLTKKQISKLIEFKNHKNKDVRYSLVSALPSVDNLKVIETLIELSEDKFSAIRNWATFGIGTLNEVTNDRILKALWNRTKDKHQETRFEAIKGLANRKQVAVKEQIINELKGGKYTILLFDAIIELNDKEFIPYLENDFNSAKNKSNTNKVWLSELKECLEKLNAKKRSTTPYITHS